MQFEQFGLGDSFGAGTVLELGKFVLESLELEHIGVGNVLELGKFVVGTVLLLEQFVVQTFLKLGLSGVGTV